MELDALVDSGTAPSTDTAWPVRRAPAPVRAGVGVSLCYQPTWPFRTACLRGGRGTPAGAHWAVADPTLSCAVTAGAHPLRQLALDTHRSRRRGRRIIALRPSRPTSRRNVVS